MGTLLRSLLASALAAAAFANVSTATVVHACSCATNDQSVQFSIASRVFLGTVVEVIPSAAADSPGYVTVRFQASHVWKGPADSNIVVRTASEGASCGIALVTGIQYVVYTNGDPSFLETGLCSGTYGVTGADPAIALLGPGTTVAPTGVAPEVVRPGDSSRRWPLAVAGVAVVTLAGVAGAATVRRVRRGR